MKQDDGPIQPISSRIKAARLRAGYSLAGLAAARGVTKGSQVQMERSGSNPRYSTLLELVRLGLDPVMLGLDPAVAGAEFRENGTQPKRKP